MPVFICSVHASETHWSSQPNFASLGMSRSYTTADVLAFSMDIPLPEKDDLSDDDDFDGYIHIRRW